MVQSAKHIVILTGAGILPSRASRPFAPVTVCGKSTGSKTWRRRRATHGIPLWCRALQLPPPPAAATPHPPQSGPLCAGQARAPAAGLRHPGDPEHRQPARERRQQEPHSHARGAAQGALPGSGQVIEWRGDLQQEELCTCCQFPQPLRPHVVWFGEMPLGLDRIYSVLAQCDLFISIGTSGAVYPAPVSCTRRD